MLPMNIITISVNPMEIVVNITVSMLYFEVPLNPLSM